jgi:hypothetical protein
MRPFGDRLARKAARYSAVTNPRVHGRLYSAAHHACLFAAETSCEHGNHYLDRTLPVDTLAVSGYGFFDT